MTTGEDGPKEQRPPARVAVFTLDSSTVYSVCMPLHRRMLWTSDRGSSNDIASLVGGAVDRIFQPLRDQIDHTHSFLHCHRMGKGTRSQPQGSKGIDTQRPS